MKCTRQQGKSASFVFKEKAEDHTYKGCLQNLLQRTRSGHWQPAEQQREGGSGTAFLLRARVIVLISPDLPATGARKAWPLTLAALPPGPLAPWPPSLRLGFPICRYSHRA